MALIRKIHEDWKPSENKELKVGDTVDISDYRRLVELGHAELIDEKGNAIPLPGTVFVCAICFAKIDEHTAYVDHILKNHSSAKANQLVDTEEETESDEIKKPSDFGAKMAKARAEARAKREALKTASKA